VRLARGTHGSIDQAGGQEQLGGWYNHDDVAHTSPSSPPLSVRIGDGVPDVDPRRSDHLADAVLDKMIDSFLILDHGAGRPEAARVVFCDGSGGDNFREQSDLDLSHWRPNRTPRQYRADTSTEICFRFLDDAIRADWKLAVNNHLDVDGMLSVYTLVKSSHALTNRRAIVQAAEMGDFWGWGEPPAQRLFQGLTLLMDRGRGEGLQVQSIYEEAFRRVPGLLEQSEPQSAEIEQSLEPLRCGVRLVEQGAIRRIECGARFTHYVVPSAIVGPAVDRATYIPRFNECISDKALLWPQARARWDDQRVCLVSAAAPRGWLHDLFFPGYFWADVQDRWIMPGMSYRDGMESYDLDLPAFERAIGELNDAESGGGRWTIGAREFMFSSKIQSQYPLVARVLDNGGDPVASHLAPEQVAATLAPVFQDM
jgi:hypothetical protein